ncbi:MAG: hypothetical protein KDC52_06115 [Ignavibacteriae bacterium]|nr:hypothetical protein [Ignavibacteriota bacterium]MCB0751030.1 hypothetical protein [Ignavibacteriota bacterium]
MIVYINQTSQMAFKHSKYLTVFNSIELPFMELSFISRKVINENKQIFEYFKWMHFKIISTEKTIDSFSIFWKLIH